MKQTYYTPSIEEFHVGFEYEFLNFDSEWKLVPICGTWYSKSIATTHSLSIVFKNFDYNLLINKDTKEPKYRVKHLDRENVENLGWLFTKNLFGDFYTKKQQEQMFYLQLFPDNFISIGLRKEIEDEKRAYFCGTIKNKSELQKLMTQLNIK